MPGRFFRPSHCVPLVRNRIARGFAFCPKGTQGESRVLRFVPRGHNVKAWGNAPGKWREEGKAPTGRNEFATSCRPVGAFRSFFGVNPGRCPGLSPCVPLARNLIVRFARNRIVRGRHTLWALGPESRCVFRRLSCHQ